MFAKYNSNLYYFRVVGRLKKGIFAVAIFESNFETIKFFNSFKEMWKYYRKIDFDKIVRCFKKSYVALNDFYDCINIDSHTYYLTNNSKLVINM